MNFFYHETKDGDIWSHQEKMELVRPCLHTGFADSRDDPDFLNEPSMSKKILDFHDKRKISKIQQYQKYIMIFVPA